LSNKIGNRIGVVLRILFVLGVFCFPSCFFPKCFVSQLFRIFIFYGEDWSIYPWLVFSIILFIQKIRVGYVREYKPLRKRQINRRSKWAGPCRSIKAWK